MGMFDWIDSALGTDAQPSSEASALAIGSLCREGGWDLRCNIGSEPARSLGGSGAVAKGSSGTAILDLALAFELDEGYDPPQGSVRLIRPSRFLGGENNRGFWKVDADTVSPPQLERAVAS
jgi:hypothetical protein